MNDKDNEDLQSRLGEVKKVWHQWMASDLVNKDQFIVDFYFFCLDEPLLKDIEEAFVSQGYSYKVKKTRTYLILTGYEIEIGVKQAWTQKTVLAFYQMFFEFAEESGFDFEGCGAVFEQS